MLAAGACGHRLASFQTLQRKWLRVLERFELLNYIRSTVLMTPREYLVSTKASQSFAINK